MNDTAQTPNVEPPSASPHAAKIGSKPCRGCNEPILWCTTEAGKYIPVNPTPDPNGNLIFTEPGKVRYLKRGEVLGYPPPPRYTSHFSDCPAADRFRAKPAAAKHTDPDAAKQGAGIIASFRAAAQKGGT